MKEKVLLISQNRFLNRALKNLLSEEMGLVCEVFGLHDLLTMGKGLDDGSEPQRLLLLLDLIGVDLDTLAKHIEHYHSNGQTENRIVAVYNISRDSGSEKKLLEIGVRGVFYEDDELQNFKKGISSLLDGEIWFPRKILYDFLKEKPSMEDKNFQISTDNFQLTPREKEILVLLSSGKSNAQIAEELFISQSTVKTHIYNIFQKINVPNRIQAALWTVKHLSAQLS